MNIGTAARRSGLPAKTLRYYETIGLVVPSGRQENGYRAYDERDVHLLTFVRRARSLGFSVADCRDLLGLYRDRHRASADVKALAQSRIEEIGRKIERLETPGAHGAAVYRFPPNTEVRYPMPIRWRLAAVISLSVASICLWGTLVGSMLPLVFRQLGFDPGYASTPFVATFVDVTGIVVYFSVARVFLL